MPQTTMVQTIIAICILVLLASLNAFIAYRKGFNMLIWFLSGGIPGLIAILLLPSANKFKRVDKNVYIKRRRTANIVGLVLIVLGIIFSVSVITQM
ncbi:MAG TPA: hypothetical protein PKH02_05725 [Bacteroidales bacterium]|nr:hypothetical protein [Bacteroidales bacterium]HPT12345.1 hypothetical protein [Bacteroidales bacterium]